MKNKLIFLMAVFLLPVALYSQEEGLTKSSKNNSVVNKNLDIPKDIRGKLNEFFKLVIKGEVSTAFQNLTVNSPIARKESEINNLIKQANRSFEIYGEIKGFEEVDVEMPTQCLLKVRYVGLHSRYPLRWIFTFYKSPDLGWIITNIKFDDLSETLFKTD